MSNESMCKHLGAFPLPSQELTFEAILGETCNEPTKNFYVALHPCEGSGSNSFIGLQLNFPHQFSGCKSERLPPIRLYIYSVWPCNSYPSLK